MTQHKPEHMAPGFQNPVFDRANRRSGNLRLLLDSIETLLLAAVLFLGINLVSARIRVEGDSMLPTLRTGEFLLVNRLAYQFDSPRHGDVIVFRFPGDLDQEFIKRVIGLPGDEVKMMRGEVLLNGQNLDEDYVTTPAGYQGEWNVPSGEVFVMGDNRNNSSDSREWGSVPFEDIIGKAVFIYWPPDQWGMIEHPSVVHAGN